MWKKINSLSEDAGMCPRSGHTAVLDGSKVMVFGGYTGKEVLGDLWTFDLESLEWLEIETMLAPSARMSHAACIDQGRMYIHGGSGLNIGSENLDDLWELNLTSLTFTEVRQKTRSPPLYGHTLNSYKNSLYLFGGTNGFDYYKDIYQYDLIINTWTKIQV